MTAQPAPLLYLSGDDVRAAMPPVEQRLELARKTMIALVDDADVPPKFGVDARPGSAHSAAMPALLRGPGAEGEDDLLGMKWVTAFPTNRDIGLPAIHATVLLTDALTGVPRAILDGAPITAERTAAVSGLALAEWWPQSVSAPSVAMIGGGVQGRSHVSALAEVSRGRSATLTICDRHQDRAEELAALAASSGSFSSVRATTEMLTAVRQADIVVTMISFGSPRQILPLDELNRASLVVAVDYDMCIPAAFVERTRIFLTDDVAQLIATRRGPVFAGYPDPDGSIGQVLLGRDVPSRAGGPVYVNHLGVGLADVVFGDAIVGRARDMGIGTVLPR